MDHSQEETSTSDPSVLQDTVKQQSDVSGGENELATWDKAISSFKRALDATTSKRSIEELTDSTASSTIDLNSKFGVLENLHDQVEQERIEAITVGSNDLDFYIETATCKTLKEKVHSLFHTDSTSRPTDNHIAEHKQEILDGLEGLDTSYRESIQERDMYRALNAEEGIRVAAGGT